LYCIPQRVFLSKQTHYQLKTKKFVYRNLHGIYITGAEVAKKKIPAHLRKNVAALPDPASNKRAEIGRTHK
jgi:hypothetical protein